MTINRRTMVAALAAAAFAPRAARASAGISLHDVAYDPAQPVLGNPEGDVSIVEFFDYACPTCKTLHPQLKQLVETDGNIRLVMKDWPINGEIVLYAARMVLAADHVGLYEQAHLAAMSLAGPLSHGTVDDALRSAAVNPSIVRDALDLHLPAIDALIDRNREQAERLQLTGTPSFLVANRLYRGALTADQIAQAVNAARRR